MSFLKSKYEVAYAVMGFYLVTHAWVSILFKLTTRMTTWVRLNRDLTFCRLSATAPRKLMFDSSVSFLCLTLF